MHLHCLFGAQLSPRGGWVVDHMVGYCGMSLNPTITLVCPLKQLFPDSFLLHWELMRAPKADQGSGWEKARGLSVPTQFCCRLLELVTPENRYWQRMLGTQWDLTQPGYFCGLLFSGFPVDLPVTSQKNLDWHTPHCPGRGRRQDLLSEINYTNIWRLTA